MCGWKWRRREVDVRCGRSSPVCPDLAEAQAKKCYLLIFKLRLLWLRPRVVLCGHWDDPHCSKVASLLTVTAHPSFLTCFADPGRDCLHPESRWSNKWSFLKCGPLCNRMWRYPKVCSNKRFLYSNVWKTQGVSGVFCVACVVVVLNPQPAYFALCIQSHSSMTWSALNTELRLGTATG